MIWPRYIQPGYDSSCSAELIEFVNCSFARQLYARFAARKYGIDICIEDNFDKFLIKKQLLELNLIYDPELCVLPPCCAPCGVFASLQVFNTISCYPPTNASAVFVVPPVARCSAPEDVSAIIQYQTP